ATSTVWGAASPSPPATPPAVAAPKIPLAVIPFSGPTAGVPEGFGEALGEAIRHGFRQVRGVRLVDSDDIQAAGQRLNISFADALSNEAALKLARELKVRGMVIGTYSLDGDTLKVQAKIVDAGDRSQVLPQEEMGGPAGEFLSGQERVARHLLQQVRVPLSPYDERRLQAAFAKQTSSLDAYASYARGMWQQGLGTREGHEQAIALFGKALEADQNFALAHVGLGISLYATSNRWKASGEFRKAIQLDGSFADAYKWLGDLLVNSPRRLYDQAIQAYQKAVDLSPDYAEAFVGLGDARQAKGQFDEAIMEYRKALHLEPENARVHFGLGKIYYNEKQLYHEAVAEYEQAIKLEPKFIEAHMNLADLYQEKGLYQEAIARYTQVLSIDSHHPGATYGLAMAYEKVDPKQAIQQWEKYIELASSLPSEKEWVDIAKKHLNKLQRGE
ncbi:MAG TPA: tetratricopeptide repeat protein, partial [Candidatus Acidoferrum sp.]|nr:tetratricopeptide repeat protein [Candidatus Acidoferrum sp.]